MSYLSVQDIKTLKKHELKLELTNCGFDGQGEKEDLVNRLTKAISEIPNDVEKHQFTTKGANVSVEPVKEIFKDVSITRAKNPRYSSAWGSLHKFTNRSVNLGNQRY